MKKSPRSKKTPVFHSGFTAILGAPNAGKSTFLNHVLGEKISITSSKPQTTRNRILGILHRKFSQIVFIDTPGIHRSKKPLNIRIVDTALSAIADVDTILVIADAASPDPESETIILNSLQSLKKPVLLALNKIDLIKKSVLLRRIESWSTAFAFQAVVPISARNGDQIEPLIVEMESLLPPGPPFFPEDNITDVSQRFLVGEMIREKTFRLTGQEIPYSVAVTVDQFQEKKGGSIIYISATIHVERDSQKGIIIGRNGTKLKQIGASARKSIERLVGARVFLKLFVRVQKNWSSDTRALRKFGY